MEVPDGFSVAAAGLIVDVRCMPAFSPAGPGTAWTRKGLWPHGTSALDVPCDAGRDTLPEDYEAVAPSAISCSPDELDALLLGALYTGPWGWWLKDLRWPFAEPEHEVGAGTGEEEPQGEFQSGLEEENAPPDAGDFSPILSAADIAVPFGDTDEEADAPFFSAAPQAASTDPALPLREAAPQQTKKKKEKAPPKTKLPKASPVGPAKAPGNARGPKKQQAAASEAQAEKNGDMQELVKLMTMMQSEMKSVAGRLHSLEDSGPAEKPAGTFAKWGSLPGATLHPAGRAPPPPPGYPQDRLPPAGRARVELPRPALEQVRRETAAPSSQAPRRRQPVTASCRPMENLNGEPLDDVEDAEVTGELAPGSLSAAMTLLAKNQAALTTLLADRDTITSNLQTGGSSGSAEMSLKGPGLLLRRRRQFDQDPGKSFDALTDRAAELQHADEGGSGSLERYGREIVPWGNNKLVKRFFLLLAKMHKAARKENLPLLKGLIAQGLKFAERVALDHGSQELAITLLPYEDAAAGPADRFPPPTYAQDPFAGLADAEESALTLKYLADMAALNKAKSERLKGSGKSKDKDKTKDKAKE